MIVYYFSFFTNQEVTLFLLAAFTVAGVLIGLVLYASKRLFDKISPGSVPGNRKDKFSIGKALVVSFGLITSIIL